MAQKRSRVRKAPRAPKLRSRRWEVTRKEFETLLLTLNQRAEFMDMLRHDLDIQFKRIAHLQADVDELRRLLSRVTAA